MIASNSFFLFSRRVFCFDGAMHPNNMEKYVCVCVDDGKYARHKHLKFIGIHFIVRKKKAFLSLSLVSKLFLECWQFWNGEFESKQNI